MIAKGGGRYEVLVSRHTTTKKNPCRIKLDLKQSKKTMVKRVGED